MHTELKTTCDQNEQEVQEFKGGVKPEAFDMMKKHSGAAERSYSIGKVFWYNIEDNHESGATKWDHNCGLINWEDGKRPAWGAFLNQTE